MKSFIRNLIFAYMAVTFSQSLVKTLVILDTKSFWMLILALTLLNTFKRHILELTSLPSKGPIFTFISAALTVLLLNILVAIIPDFSFFATVTPIFNIFGFVIPSTYLSAVSAGILSGIAISLVADFMHWLCAKNKK